jgi:phosphopantetheinyl transferase
MIELWVQRVNALSAPRAGTMLSRSERTRANSFRSARERVRYLAVHSWVHQCLPGMPLLVDRRGALAPADGAGRLSLSDHGGWVVLAHSADEPVGVDVLAIPPDADFIDDTALVLSGPEIDWVWAHAPDLRGAAFALTWVRKEAYAKLRGTGLTADLARVTLTPDVGPPRASFWTGRLPDGVVAVATATEAEVVVRGADRECQPVSPDWYAALADTDLSVAWSTTGS